MYTFIVGYPLLSYLVFLHTYINLANCEFKKNRCAHLNGKALASSLPQSWNKQELEEVVGLILPLFNDRIFHNLLIPLSSSLLLLTHPTVILR